VLLGLTVPSNNTFEQPREVGGPRLSAAEVPCRPLNSIVRWHSASQEAKWLPQPTETKLLEASRT